MEELEGIKIISKTSNSSNQAIEFVIIEKEKTRAIDAILKYIDSGYIVTLNDNRDKREGSISFKKENELYLTSRGGHGFSIDWELIEIKDLVWLIKVTSPFNNGDIEGSNGAINKNS